MRLLSTWPWPWRGPAAQVLLNLDPVDRTSFDGLITALERGFGRRQSADESRERLASCHRQDGEHLGDLAEDVWLHTQRGYPPVQPRRTLPCVPSCVRCPQNACRQHVRLAAPRSLDDLQEAERAEAIIPPPSHPPIPAHTLERQATRWGGGPRRRGARPPGATLRSPDPAMTNASYHPLSSL